MSDTFTREKLQEIIKLFGEMPRKSVFHYTRFLDDMILHGDRVDEMLQQQNSWFDPKRHKGYLVPEQFRESIEKHFADKGLKEK